MNRPRWTKLYAKLLSLVTLGKESGKHCFRTLTMGRLALPITVSCTSAMNAFAASASEQMLSEVYSDTLRSYSSFAVETLLHPYRSQMRDDDQHYHWWTEVFSFCLAEDLPLLHNSEVKSSPATRAGAGGTATSFSFWQLPVVTKLKDRKTM